MGTPWCSASVAALGVALALSASEPARAQTDSTRQTQTDSTRRTVHRARSSRVIPVHKDVTTQSSGGEVVLTESMRIDSLTAATAADRARLDSLDALARSAAARADSAAARAEENAKSLGLVNDTLRAVRGDLTTVTTRAAALNDSVVKLNGSVHQLRNRLANGSIFGNSGFYVGLGTGANFTTGTLHNIGYDEGLNVAVPIGWHRPGSVLGFRAELGVQTFDGLAMSGFTNPDPKLYTALAMLSLHFPLNQAKSNNFYLLGGGGAYMFRDVGAFSSLAERLDNSASFGTGGTNKTKFGVTGGAGLEFHILGATSLFVESRYTNVFADAGTTGGDTGKNLRWIPVIAGLQIK